MKDSLVASAWQSRVLGARLEHWAEKQPNKKFLKCDGDWLSWSDAAEQTARVASGLQAAGIGKGDRVAMISATRSEMALAFLALARIGAIAVPMNTFLRGEFLRFQLADAAAGAVISDGPGLGSLAAVAEDLPDLRTVIALDPPQSETPALPGSVSVIPFETLTQGGSKFTPPELHMADPIALMYTSGTTGLPKGCIYSHGYYMAAPIACMVNDWFGHDDVIFTAFPMFHSAGLALMLGGTLQSGASICFDGAFSAGAFIERVIDCGATVAHGVGPMGMAILATPESPLDRKHQLRLCTWPPMGGENQERFEQRFGVDVLCGGYGQTESVPLTTMNAADAKGKRASLGRPCDHMEVCVVDDDDSALPAGTLGEIVARPRTPQTMYQGYWGRPDATVEASRNLWHHTGDLGRFDEDGFLYFVDRKKDAMRRRGENISSFELEQAILKHEAIAAAATHAVPSELGEDDIKACLVFQPGKSATPEALFEYFKNNLPYFAVPRYVEIMESLPVNASGRVMKHLLRERGVGDAWDFEAMNLRVERHERRG